MGLEKIRFTSVDEEREYGNEKFNPKAMLEENHCKVILAFFRKGQFIPVHSPSVDLFLYIVEGTGEVFAGEKPKEVKGGDMVMVPRGLKRGVKAATDMTVLHVVTPAPTEKDHEGVMQGFKRGSWI